MPHFYYSPFKTTDANERRAWNYYLLKKEATFLSSMAPLTQNQTTPEKLATQLAKDGLPDRKINVRLLVCFGAVRHHLDPKFQDWREAQQGRSIASRLAVALSAKASQVRVAGYLGPSHNDEQYGMSAKPLGETGIQVKVRSKVRDPQNDRPMSMAEFCEAVASGALHSGDTVAVKGFVVWFDTTGQPAQKHENGPARAQQVLDEAARKADFAMKPLSCLQDGDTLLIKGHGKDDGTILGTPGDKMTELTGMPIDQKARAARQKAGIEKSEVAFSKRPCAKQPCKNFAREGKQTCELHSPWEGIRD